MTTDRSLADWLVEVALRLRIEISETQRDQMLTYFELLLEWNRKINLTGITENADIAERHVLDSLTVLEYLDRQEMLCPKNSAPSLVDVGSGAGIPGILIKIMRPHWQILLIDPLAKRVNFQKLAIDTVGLTGIEAWHGRAEQAGQRHQWREQFDLAVARAVANLAVLAEYCLPLVKVGGSFVAMKGRLEKQWPEAKRAVTLLGGALETIDGFNLPGTDMGRNILLIRKKKKTADTFPRQPGRPAKYPL